MNESVWNLDIELVQITGYKPDKNDNQIAITKKNEVCAYENSISRTEFYIAGQKGIQISKILIVHPYEYEGELSLFFEGQEYDIIKTYQLNHEELELTCKVKLSKKVTNA